MGIGSWIVFADKIVKSVLQWRDGESETIAVKFPSGRKTPFISESKTRPTYNM